MTITDTRINELAARNLELETLNAELLTEVDNLKTFIGLYTGFDVNDPAQNAARYDGYLDGIQVGLGNIAGGES